MVRLCNAPSLMFSVPIFPLTARLFPIHPARRKTSASYFSNEKAEDSEFVNCKQRESNIIINIMQRYMQRNKKLNINKNIY